jgi:hypothetical protein
MQGDWQMNHLWRILVAAILAVLVVNSSGIAQRSDKIDSSVALWPVTLVDGGTKRPLSGISVVVNGATADKAEPQTMTLTSDHAGRVEIPLAPGTSTVVNVASAGWWTVGWPIVGEVDIDKDGKFDLPLRTADHSIELWRGTEVKGKLLAPDGTPAAEVVLNAGVYVHDSTWLERMGRPTDDWNSWDHGEWPNWENATKTRMDGTFSITVPPQSARSWIRVGTGGLGFQSVDGNRVRPHRSSAAIMRYAPLEVEVNGRTDNRRVEESDGVVDLGNLQLNKGIVVKGHVVDANGKPLAGVLLFTSSRHGPYAGRKAVSQADGTFEFSPMNPGRFTLSPDATLRDEAGEKRSREVQAVFVSREVTLTEIDHVVELTVQALSHVDLEFEWVDRRAKKGPVSYYGEFALIGFVPRAGSKPVWWRGETEKISRDGKELLVVKVPKSVTDILLYLPADQRVTASYADDVQKSGPGQIKLGDITKPMRRIIYGDEPRPENAQKIQ